MCRPILWEFSLSAPVLTLLTLRKQPWVDSENGSFSRGLVAKLVLTLFENKSNLGFRHDVVGLLSEFINSRTL